jgi:RNA recognition motif-containing protein
MMGGMPGFGPPGGMRGIAPVSKPNPYAIVETKHRGDENIEVTFKYPKSKIFVGGLDFKLTVEELKQHFQQYGEVVDACILKDVYTGQSRGFGFVTFKDEDVAQNLINNIMVVTINGRKADIKKAEVKQGGPSFGGPPGVPGFAKPGMHHG